MRTTRVLVSALSVCSLLSPSLALACGMGEGGGGMPGLTYGISIDVSDTREVQPDLLRLVGSCQVVANTEREATSAAEDFADEVQQDVRGLATMKTSEVTIYPANDPYTGAVLSRQFAGSFSVTLEVASAGNVETLSELLEDRACSVYLEAVVTDEHRLHNAALPELRKQLKSRTALFETLLGQELTPLSVSISSYIDTYSSYDPETNTALATTTLSMQFATAD